MYFWKFPVDLNVQISLATNGLVIKSLYVHTHTHTENQEFLQDEHNGKDVLCPSNREQKRVMVVLGLDPSKSTSFQGGSSPQPAGRM